ncbi:MAG: PEP-CTERM sorting domain-containing protein [Acidobacteria bacterium]|nr:PEP-CTERM sorting domain-containing protein [Acidobacteriota bacterium]
MFTARFVQLVLAFASLPLMAAPVTIVSYDITDAALSGHGGPWAHTYSGTITPGASFTNSGFSGTIATYSGGSGTLNDGVLGGIAASQLFVQGSPTTGPTINPVLTLHLSGSFVINSISIFGGEHQNAIPGCFTGVTVGIGSSSSAIATTAFGTSAGSCFRNDLALITGSALDGIATSTITLSQFTGPLYFNWFSITEIQIDGTPADGAIPEPSQTALIGFGLSAMTLLLRRRAKS